MTHGLLDAPRIKVQPTPMVIIYETGLRILNGRYGMDKQVDKYTRKCRRLCHYNSESAKSCFKL